MSGLGTELKATRTLRGLSLAAVAEPAKISTAYLQKLEGAMVQNPSPRVLMRLAEVLDTSYERLMELADYTMPQSSTKDVKPTFLEAALKNEELSDEEQRAVIAFIFYLKGNRPEK
ncbi:helix-turn-helix domain-containing protein [bacterium]|nr:helix-turn-helix domain-containing protein [bacterium]